MGRIEQWVSLSLSMESHQEMGRWVNCVLLPYIRMMFQVVEIILRRVPAQEDGHKGEKSR